MLSVCAELLGRETVELVSVDYTERSPSDPDNWMGVIMRFQLGNQLWMLTSGYGIAKSRNARWCMVGNGWYPISGIRIFHI